MWFKSGQTRERPPIIFAAVWLVYLIFPISSMMEQSAGEIVLDCVLILLFAAVYLISFTSRRYRMLFVFVQLAVISFFCFRYHSSFLYMAFYPSPVIGTIPGRKMLIGMGGMVLLFGAVIFEGVLYLHYEELLQLLPAMMVMLAMPFVMRAGVRSRELRNKLTMANEEISRLSKVEERQRISRDLHDTLGHTLSLITLKSELTERLIPLNPERAIKEAQDVQAASRAALSQVRELVSGMNSVTFQEEIIRAKQILSAAGIVLEVKGRPEQDISPVIDNIIGMCLREAVTNVVKHSKASLCVVEPRASAGAISVAIEDNGTGMADGAGKGSGLAGMRERLKFVEGSLRTETPPSGGTRVIISVPRVVKGIVTE